ncbi:MAG: HEPN domain-containing protein [Magnetococcales bacterium]|nr:HEPN domain-containing protein [Magnetococcales bacterium]
MKKPEQNYALEWLKKAEHDLITARTVLALTDGPTDTPSFHAQQAVEKALKGVLTWHGIAFGKTHDLLALFDQVAEFLPDLARFEASFAAMNDYAVEARYPGDACEPDRIDAMDALEVAEQVVARITQYCGISRAPVYR